tara:strand:- start:8791 stop:8973 length:183 start_codon:yes stop_codon:yes gene_type:complete
MSMTVTQKLSSKFETEKSKLETLQNKLFQLLESDTQQAIKQEIEIDLNTLSIDQLVRKWL